ncbi:hypothetical protein Y032_0593g413 [Ancylostoma ceylanicum]|uniref:Uncharacterized protein n=1 Tax=Ancylostoma ceylanicum TaxID=53326 RepID=A0A016WM16_9BILA|nr:hypothetical protein Y032_0593g413 [Ancylostoma ceylanicum]
MNARLFLYVASFPKTVSMKISFCLANFQGNQAQALKMALKRINDRTVEADFLSVGHDPAKVGGQCVCDWSNRTVALPFRTYLY